MQSVKGGIKEKEADRMHGWTSAVPSLRRDVGLHASRELTACLFKTFLSQTVHSGMVYWELWCQHVCPTSGFAVLPACYVLIILWCLVSLTQFSGALPERRRTQLCSWVLFGLSSLCGRNEAKRQSIFRRATNNYVFVTALPNILWNRHGWGEEVTVKKREEKEKEKRKKKSS